MRWEITGEPASCREPGPGTQVKGSEHSRCSRHKGKQRLAGMDPLGTQGSSAGRLEGSKLGGALRACGVVLGTGKDSHAGWWHWLSRDL